MTSAKIFPKVAFPYLIFENPVDLQSAPDGFNRLFVVEQKGVIKVFNNQPHVQESKIFLDIQSLVNAGHLEEGLLGLTFHPQYKDNRKFYVFYSGANPRRSIIAEYQTSDNDPDKAEPSSAKIIMEILKPFGNHNGGQIVFGPDNYLYISLGDGGSAGDPYGHAQDRKTLLGSILRINVDVVGRNKNYDIPSDNPFFENTEGFMAEIYAYGLRNVWRFSFDPVTKKLWAGDVGQDKPKEEVNIIEKGKNYGWNIMEGSECFRPPEGCKHEGLELPIWEYTVTEGRSITGGYVYRGKELPGLYGRYIYGDFISGRIWALQYENDNSHNNEMIYHDSNLYISSFGIDQNQEIYFCSFDGHIYKFVKEG